MYYVYLIECEDKTLYTGITTDVQRRFREHNSGKGGAYTRSKKVTKVLYTEQFKTRSEALKRESEIKSWPREKKLDLIQFGKPTSLLPSSIMRDPKFTALVKEYGTPDLRRGPARPGKNPFQALVRSIIYQQLSGKAAATILMRFTALFNTRKFPTPENVLDTSIPKLRAVGLSAQKTMYIKDLAKKFSDGTIQYRSLNRMTNEEVIAHLTQVKGIGIWTAHMFLIFTLNRPDILPTGDLGIRKGFQLVYKLKNLPDHKTMERLAMPWRKHASIASWYLWRVADKAKIAN